MSVQPLVVIVMFAGVANKKWHASPCTLFTAYVHAQGTCRASGSSSGCFPRPRSTRCWLSTTRYGLRRPSLFAIKGTACVCVCALTQIEFQTARAGSARRVRAVDGGAPGDLPGRRLRHRGGRGRVRRRQDGRADPPVGHQSQEDGRGRRRRAPLQVTQGSARRQSFPCHPCVLSSELTLSPVSSV